MLLAHCLFFITVASAQSSSVTIKATLNRDHVLIGEPVELHIEVRGGPDHPVTRWLNLPDSFNQLEVLGRSPVDTVSDAAVTSYRQTFTITGFEPGVWMIPALKININKKAAYTDSLALTIVPVQLKDSAYHDIRTIIDVQDTKTSWWYRAAGLLSLAALGILAWLWLKSRRGKPMVAGAPAGTLSPLEEAISKLRALEAEHLANKEEWKKYYSALTGIFKKYIEKRFGSPALQKTTGELLLMLNGMLDKQVVSETAEALRIADAVKFARYQPGRDTALASLHIIETAIRALEHVKQ